LTFDCYFSATISLYFQTHHKEQSFQVKVAHAQLRLAGGAIL